MTREKAKEKIKLMMKIINCHTAPKGEILAAENLIKELCEKYNLKLVKKSEEKKSIPITIIKKQTFTSSVYIIDPVTGQKIYKPMYSRSSQYN